MNELKNCDELSEFSKKWATGDSGSLGKLSFNELSDNLKLLELSMGMSSDYLKACEYKATFLRIGSKIFGSRY